MSISLNTAVTFTVMISLTKWPNTVLQKLYRFLPVSRTTLQHIYSNHVHSIVKSHVITLDISDHLRTYVQFSVDPNFVIYLLIMNT